MLVRVTSHRDPEPLALDAFERLARHVLTMESAPEESELSIAIVDVEEMARLNEQYRGIEGPTDVLSFGCDDPCLATEGEPIVLGDVIIAPEVAERQAQELGVTVESELNLLLVHGILHLFGYDHESDEDAAVMQARERAVLDAYAPEP
ncbi:MAG: rRNA maturation RNase YbeY [Anaerosomatales bacterium]|nr:rRNA maturation RNase YbeY [Coriobacteriia bacterium]MDI6692865.1 rRNA maturation RNase YbeY [Anaerosomatales bacterium]MDI6844016.1 rRNA maturation RNase YbeY [Anaerosomatales bacterium]GAV31150.1 endoribonuclease YbeY [Coriobacteriaceae bacterium EMTCatB1]